MMKSKVKCWMLTAIKKFSKKEGVYLNDLFRKRPVFISDDLPSFVKNLEEMEKEGFIKRNNKFLAPCYILTKKGKMEIRKVLFKMGQIEQKELRRSIPAWDLEDRISATEGFLGSLLMIGVLWIIVTLFEINDTSNVIITTSIGIFVLFFFLSSFFFASSVIFNFLYDLIETISSTIVELMGQYKRQIIIILFILLLIGSLFAFVSLTKYGWSDFIFYGIMAIIAGAVSFVVSKISDKSKK
jgi:DNA-binding PadR family transcriptional regulator